MAALEAFRNLFQGDKKSKQVQSGSMLEIPVRTEDKSESFTASVSQGSDKGSLTDRLSKTIDGFTGKEEEARLRRIKSTDLIRGERLERYRKHNVDTFTQIQLIHKIHMGGNEAYLLKEDQALWIRSMKPKVERIAGVVRSKDEIPQNISLANGLTPCASFDRTPELLEGMVRKADELFPPDRLNPRVNKDSIFYYLSAVQYSQVLIHPFLEANARTSEDAMYIFWHRRPDLYPVHYVSSDGQRENRHCFDRENIIREGARSMLYSLAWRFYLSYDELSYVQRYPDLLKALQRKYGVDPDQLEVRYLNMFDKAVGSFIEGMDKIEVLKNNPTICALADNLASSPTQYNFAAK